ncbi:MAG: hypothetical protein ACLPSW_36095, partial [Roseiarcus sp.]
FFQFVHNARKRGKALLSALVEALVALAISSALRPIFRISKPTTEPRPITLEPGMSQDRCRPAD